jgi:large conductance mechanosensitive channel
MGFWSDFKAFAMKGSLVDVAIAFVMGAAFNKVISGFTEGLISPIVGLLTGGQNFTKMKWVLRAPELDAAGKVLKEGVVFQYGLFITNIIDFFIVAFVCYLILKKIMKKDPNAAPAPTKTEELLMEIRDSLKK